MEIIVSRDDFALARIGVSIESKKTPRVLNNSEG